ncbi:MAG: flavin reductase family protein [Bacteroidota bacterium]
MLTIDPKETSLGQMHGLLLGAVAPRPIAFASTIDKEGHVNLSPFSFFNAFSAAPPIVVFSPARRGRDATTKDTLDNVLQVSEVVINIVNYPIVQQMSLSSTEYDKGVNEFDKAGLTEVPSERVAPPRVGESPASFECKVLEIKSMGEHGGAGNLVICEVLLAHFDERIIDENGKIDPFKLDAVARMGGNWYARAQGDVLFEIPKPLSAIGIGVDQIPDHIKNSHFLSGNDLGQLGTIGRLPTSEEIEKFKNSSEGKKLFENSTDPDFEKQLHLRAKEYIAKGDVTIAWKVLSII